MAVLVVTGALSASHFTPSVAAASNLFPDSEHYVFTPLVWYQHTPQGPLDWDERLNERGATFVPAQVASGQAYWRLVRAVWYDEQESQRKHHIFVDTWILWDNASPAYQ